MVQTYYNHPAHITEYIVPEHFVNIFGKPTTKRDCMFGPCDTFHNIFHMQNAKLSTVYINYNSVNIVCPCHRTIKLNFQCANDLDAGLLTIILSGADFHVIIKTTRLIVPNYMKKPKSWPSYTTYNETCETCGASGTPAAYEPLPLSVWRSFDDTRGTQYHQTTGQAPKSWG
jgi:hypothetical protein